MVDPWPSTIGLGQGLGVKAIPPNPESQDHHSTWFCFLLAQLI